MGGKDGRAPATQLRAGLPMSRVTDELRGAARFMPKLLSHAPLRAVST
jgi:hypothetical protein